MKQGVAMQATGADEAAGSDRDLWRSLAAGDESAFRELFLRHSDAVYNFCFRRTASWSAAEDAVQCTFAALWRRARSASVDELRLESARPVLLAMARDQCSNANRAGQRRLSLVDRVGTESSSATEDNTAAWVEAESTMHLIREALAVLPAHQRDVVELVAWSELSLQETAAALGISVGTVKSRLARARARLTASRSAHLLGDHR